MSCRGYESRDRRHVEIWTSVCRKEGRPTKQRGSDAGNLATAQFNGESLGRLLFDTALPANESKLVT